MDDTEFHDLADWDGEETDSEDEESGSEGDSCDDSDGDEYDEVEAVARIARHFDLYRRISKGAVWEGARVLGERRGALIIKLDYRGAHPPCEARALSKLQDCEWAPRCDTWMGGTLKNGNAWSAAILEKVPGVPLDARRLAADEVISVTRQLLAMCADLHARGYVHCDFRATNALMEGEGTDIRVRLIDFDCAQRQDADGEPLCHCVGARAARAPEKRRCSYGKPADIWAIGIVAGQLLLGIRDCALPDKGFENVIRAVLKGETPLEQLILRLLAEAPDNRPTAATALAELP